jgi:hypothetical protein
VVRPAPDATLRPRNNNNASTEPCPEHVIHPYVTVPAPVRIRSVLIIVVRSWPLLRSFFVPLVCLDEGIPPPSIPILLHGTQRLETQDENGPLETCGIVFGRVIDLRTVLHVPDAREGLAASAGTRSSLSEYKCHRATTIISPVTSLRSSLQLRTRVW